MTTRNLPVRSEAVNTAANYPATPLAPYFYYSSYGLGDQIQRRHFEVSKETPFAISVYIRQTSSLGQAATDSFSRCPLDLFTNDVILDFDSALRWNMFRIDIQIEFTKGIFFLEVVFPSTKAHFDLTHPS